MEQLSSIGVSLSLFFTVCLTVMLRKKAIFQFHSFFSAAGRKINGNLQKLRNAKWNFHDNQWGTSTKGKSPKILFLMKNWADECLTNHSNNFFIIISFTANSIHFWEIRQVFRCYQISCCVLFGRAFAPTYSSRERENFWNIYKTLIAHLNFKSLWNYYIFPVPTALVFEA